MGVETRHFPKILAYVTAYRDETALRDCLEAIETQSLPVTHSLVVDNSPSPLVLPLNENKLSVVYCPENIGVGGGAALALERAIDQGYDFAWLLDQDSRPDTTCLQQLIQIYHEQHCPETPIAIVAPWVIDEVMHRSIGGAVFDRYRFREYFPEGDTALWIECDAPILSGTLVSISAAEFVGLPQKDLFMDGVDLEYGLRFRRSGFRNLIATKAILHHNLGTPLKVLFFKKTHFIQNYSILRSYYYYRSHTYLEVHFAQAHRKVWAALWRFYKMIKDILVTLFYRNHKLKRTLACLLGTWHGFKAVFGKTRSIPK
jgi:rhamnosyltransferase